MGEFTLQTRVYYEDTDAAGIVYHANYLKFMERARTEWLRKLGYDQRQLAVEHELGFVVRKMAIDFIRPARLDDKLAIVSKVVRCGKASIVFLQSVNHLVDGEGTQDGNNTQTPQVFCQAEVKVGCIDLASGAPQAMSENLYREIKHAS